MSDNNLNRGFWEKEGRSYIFGSFVFVFLLGTLYFTIGSILVNVYLVIDIVINGVESFSSGNYFEIMKNIYSRYKFPILIFTGICQFIIFLFGTKFLFKKWHNFKITQYFQFNKISVIGIILGVSGIIVILPLVEFTSQIFYFFFPVLKELEGVSGALFSVGNNYELAFLIFLISVTPAVCEEFIFRGYFQRTLQRKLKEPYHYIISGFVFALYHQNPMGLAGLTLVGIYLGFLYYRFGSIFVTMASHFIYNTIIILLLNKQHYFNIFLDKDKNIYWSVTFGSLLIFIVLILIIYFFTKKRVLKNNTENEKYEEKEVVVNLG